MMVSERSVYPCRRLGRGTVCSDCSGCLCRQKDRCGSSTTLHEKEVKGGKEELARRQNAFRLFGDDDSFY